jgi:hypothetical protein
MKKILALLVAAIVSTAVISDYKSTFLINGAEYSTLSWLAPDTATEKWTLATLNKIINNGDTYADVMARSTAKDFGYVNGIDRDYWRNRLNRLRSSGIQPVVWLVSDDSPDVYKLGLQNQIDYQNQVVDAVDDLVSHYVVCLECDEYYSAEQVNTLIKELRKKGVNKPIGVHLSPGVKPEYYAEADVIYLQTGFNLSEEQFRKEIEKALTIGKPVVVSEYHMDGTTARARAFGDIACSYAGVVGTGNGRGTAVCGSLVSQVEKKNEWDRIQEFAKKNEVELMMFAVLLVAAYNKFGFDEPLPFMVQYNFSNNGYSVMLLKPIADDLDAGVTYDNNGRVMLFGNKRF